MMPYPVHYAVRLALEDGIAALDAGDLATATLPSGALVALKNRRGDLEKALAREPLAHDAEAARAELAVITRLLDALAGLKAKTQEPTP